jgi:MFS family permease
LVTPVFAAFQLDRGLSLSQLGLNVAILSAVVAAMELPTGGLADSFGRRNTYLLSIAAHLLGASVLLFAFSLPLILVGFVFMGLARALSSGCMDAYFVDAHGDLSEAGPLQRFLARIGVAIPLSLAVGGVAGGFLADLDPTAFGISGGFDSYSFVFLTVVGVVLLQLLVTLILIPGRESNPELEGLERGFSRIKRVFLDATKHGVSNRLVLLLLVGTASWGVAFAGLEQYWQPYVSGISASPSPTRLFGFLTAGYFLAGSLGSLAAGTLFKIIGPRYAEAVTVLRLLIGGTLILLASTQSVVAFAVIYFTIFFLNGVSGSPEQTLFNQNVPSAVRSTLLSFESLFLQAGGGLAALLWGVLADNYSISLSWRLAGAIFILSGALYYYVRRAEAEA